MAEKQHPAGYAPTNGYSRSDEEAARGSDRELRNKKRKKWALYIIAFIIFQAGIIALFTMTVMKFRTPKYRMRPVNSLSTTSVQASSFNARLSTQLGIKNTNFGPYKYRASNISFYYKDLAVPPSLASSTEWGSAISSGVLPLTSQSRLTGKIEIMFIFKKKRAINLNCTMDLNITGKQLENITCK
ncbi:hypothetical protein Acr_03g0009140 [Actinidia rufa]|uniref:Late embryogenesis abundant (LEA) hydroxyproline-rich glycoprotein family n=1 Tax=Actinidia rufa TaxID=165716 RepID=A0A7J0ECM3_9ERIC|nr:hypothetical protein Acr_03g0009140 [Actinidia rufa]